jgi:hypothetical protein
MSLRVLAAVLLLIVLVPVCGARLVATHPCGWQRAYGDGSMAEK